MTRIADERIETARAKYGEDCDDKDTDGQERAQLSQMLEQFDLHNNVENLAHAGIERPIDLSCAKASSAIDHIPGDALELLCGNGCFGTDAQFTHWSR